jgi:hypothetical protein
VVALRTGGVTESVQEGVTGAFYDRGDDPASLAATVAAFDPDAVDPAACVAAARRFDTGRFQTALRAIVAEAVLAERAPRPGERPALATAGLMRIR